MNRSKYPHCTAPACSEPHYARGLCRRHYTQSLRRAEFTPRKPHGLQTCSVPACNGAVYARGFCSRHYQAHRLATRAGVPVCTPASPITPGSQYAGCQSPGCEFPGVLLGNTLCRRHYQQQRVRTRTGKADHVFSERRGPAGQPCEYPHCDRTAICKGLCGKHYQRFRKYGSQMPTARLLVPIPAKPCATPGCERTASVGLVCHRCKQREYARARAAKPADFSPAQPPATEGIATTNEIVIQETCRHLHQPVAQLIPS